MAEQNNVVVGEATLPRATVSPRVPWWRQWGNKRVAGSIPRQILAIFWRQMAVLIDVGVPLLKALHQVAERTSHLELREIIHAVARSIEAGNSFSSALAQHPAAFASLTVQLIQVAERGGVLDDSVRLVADELERNVELRGKIRRALAYPLTILLIGFLVAFAVLIWVIPEFTVLFYEQGLQLPWPTRILVGVAHFLASYWWLCILGGLVAVCAGFYALRRPCGRLFWDRLTLRLPLVGELLVKASILRFAQTLGTLLRGGVPILVALRLVQEHAENSVLAGELAYVYTAVDQGSRLEEPLRQSGVFPPMAVDIIAIGEEAGQLDTVLFKLAQTYRDDVDHSISIFASVLEPLLLLCMGVFAALVVWAVYLPYFALPALWE